MSGEFEQKHAVPFQLDFQNSSSIRDRDVHRYLKEHDLPYHPLWEHGYESIGDYHSTKSIHEVSEKEQLRFSGIKRECGIHEIGRETQGKEQPGL